jgi:hypothetical protein
MDCSPSALGKRLEWPASRLLRLPLRDRRCTGRPGRRTVWPRPAGAAWHCRSGGHQQPWLQHCGALSETAVKRIEFISRTVHHKCDSGYLFSERSRFRNRSLKSRKAQFKWVRCQFNRRSCSDLRANRTHLNRRRVELINHRESRGSGRPPAAPIPSPGGLLVGLDCILAMMKSRVGTVAPEAAIMHSAPPGRLNRSAAARLSAARFSHRTSGGGCGAGPQAFAGNRMSYLATIVFTTKCRVARV